MKPLTKPRLFTPGPTPLLPEAAVKALTAPMHHRKEDYKAVFRRVQKGLQEVFKTRNDVLVLSSSGSGAMESAVVNLTSPGERVLIGVAGKFGERWMELAQTYATDAQLIKVPYGESVEPGQIEAALASGEFAAVFIQATETSTGAAMDVEKIGALVKARENTVLVVDAITGLGTMPLDTDGWGLDVVIGGSQKAFMVPPGAAMISVSEKAWKRVANCKRPRYYFDLAKERKAQREAQTAYTPPISIVQGLDCALELMLQQGIDNLVANAGLQAGATRAAVTRWGMRIFPRCSGNAVTAFVPGVDPAKVISVIRNRFGVHLSGGQGTMKGQILRVGHLGYFDFLETLGMIGCLEIALQETGAVIDVGSGSRAALEYYQERSRAL
jgi:aspartate aminotransferase-like enzyme